MTPAGVFSLVSLALVVLAGILFLSGVMSNKIRFIQDLRAKTGGREAALWIHRLSVLSVLGVFTHMMSVSFVRQNTALVILSSFYVFVAVSTFLLNKFIRPNRKLYVLEARTPQNHNVHKLEFVPKDGRRMDYFPGQFAFIKFTQSALPKETHPFTISSSPFTLEDRIFLLVKESGDWTAKLSELMSGDMATVEGPYGDFFTEEMLQAGTPLVFLAGGIGITPILSLLQSDVLEPDRPVFLIWSVSKQEDLFFMDFLESLNELPHFSLRITLTQETTLDYDTGRISREYLEELGVDEHYSNGEFYLCGPPLMMESIRKLLLQEGVDRQRIHEENFQL